VLVFHVKHQHAATLREYLRALRHRNALLRSGDLATLPAWTAQLAELGEIVGETRQDYLGKIQDGVLAVVEQLSPGLSLSLGLHPGWQGGSLAEVLGRERDRDVKSGVTNAGPHRADVGIRCGAVEAVQVLSRGQGKVVASALRLAQAEDLAASGKRTLFLIDDVGAELDRAHNERFYALLDEMGGQIVATSTQAEAGGMLEGPRKGRLFHVKQGTFEAA
jgi:DNA replication and repair protein RecF